MRRRKPNATVQVNLRIKEKLRRKLEAAAKEHEVSFNQEITARLEDSLEGKAKQSLENIAVDIELAWRRFDDKTNKLVERMGSWPGLLNAKPPRQEQEEGGNT
jgi:hypothetical protein